MPSLPRRNFLSTALAALSFLSYSVQAQVPPKKNIVLGITLDPPGLDPTISAASTIAEVTLYNIYETLTKIAPDGSVQPLLAQSWQISQDLRCYIFQLCPNVYFHNGVKFNAHTVRFSLERAKSQNSTNKDKPIFSNIARITVLDDLTIQLDLEQSDADFLFVLGMATAIMVEPSSADGNRTHPIGTGPYQFEKWRHGVLLHVSKWTDYRTSANIVIEQADFMFISDPAAQMAALLSGEVDIFARAGIARGLSAFKRQPQRFQILTSDSWAKTLLSVNHRHQPLNDVHVRAAITSAIDRQTIIQAAADGLGQVIGSHYARGMPGFIDTSMVYPYDPDKSKYLLKQSGVALPLNFSLVLPPAPYARQGGEVIAAMLSRVGISIRIENVEWGHWLANVYGGTYNYDLTMISHVEPLDLGNYTKPNYYWGYQSDKFNSLYAQIRITPPGDERNYLLTLAQELLAQEAVNIWLYQPQWLTIANKAICGLWQNMPIFVNDLSALSWNT